MIPTILVIFIGFGQAQTLSITRFDSVAECEEAADIFRERYPRYEDSENIFCEELK